MKRALKAQVWIRCEATRRVLLLRMTEARGAHWQPITGSAERGESAREAALREAEEETGWRPAEVVPLGHVFEFVDRWERQVTEECFQALAPSEFRPLLDPKEHDSFEWLARAEARLRLSFESNREALDLLPARPPAPAAAPAAKRRGK
ncbi:MAG: NUDIX domain-containing protein [Bdellovibrionales bacterium]|nr:NUDIX domain-containing protein [Bdellovibrionales bacterium]